MSCCNTKPSTASPDFDAVKAVNETYSARALTAGQDTERSASIAQAFGYSPEELKAIPAEANMGLSCGNPTAVAKLKEGEACGIDVFLIAAKVGPTGQAIGLDGTMISLARKNAAKQGLKPPHVAFVQASLEKDLPIESNSIDCIISNCVINLLPPSGKANVFKEAYRVLKPGGRIVLDDIVAKKPLPDNVKSNLAGYVSCISGAVFLNTPHQYRHLTKLFADALFVDRKGDLNVYWQGDTAPSTCCSGPTDLNVRPDFPENFDANEWAGAYQIYAIKPLGDEPVEASPTTLLRWWDAYPTVKSSPQFLTADEVVDLVRNPELKDNDKLAVIDGGHWPAQTFYDDLPAFFEKHKNTEQVIFYCQSSNGRGPRSAGWYQDYLDSRAPDTHASKAYVLQGGIKGWKAKFTGDTDLLDFDN
ncbi:arsenite S-adenosylmethyltransferase [Ephemerocybe angulata]|uniref:Arsenite methyltransferase n=1 Tax=Ephemerocybe angulata TaxID=980116 RepID=A0A8H6MC58_9AGAR|nr:arsenite S-adenosylmethyltransferase [Tulosesus angulatus]